MMKSKISLAMLICSAITCHAAFAADETSAFKFDKSKSSAKVSDSAGKKKLTVTASMSVSSSGYKAVIVKSNKPGIPETRFLELKLTTPAGKHDARITPITATYEEPDFRGGVNMVNIEEPSHKQSMELNVEEP